MRLIGKWLNAGVAEGEVVSYNEKGTPQGVISPVIGNRVLDGLEAIVCNTPYYKRKHGIHFVRYADDFIVTAETKVTHIRKGFDFLGQTVRKYPRRDGTLGKLQIEPSKKSVQSIKSKVKAICKSSGQLTQAQLIERLNPVLRGWANYHRHIICGETFSQINGYTWFRLMRWGKRRHPAQR